MPVDRIPSCMPPGPLPTRRSRCRDLSSWTCLVNCVNGFPAVEHSAPPRKDILGRLRQLRNKLEHLNSCLLRHERVRNKKALVEERERESERWERREVERRKDDQSIGPSNVGFGATLKPIGKTSNAEVWRHVATTCLSAPVTIPREVLYSIILWIMQTESNMIESGVLYKSIQMRPTLFTRERIALPPW